MYTENDRRILVLCIITIKTFFPIVLQGVADAKSRFICVDVGAYGRQIDSGIFLNVHDIIQD